MRYLTWFAAILTVLFPVLALTVRGASNICFFLIFLSGLVAIICRYRPNGFSFREMFVEYWPLHLAMMGIFIAILVNQLASGQFVIRHYDSSLRLAFFPIVFWALLCIPEKCMKYVAWGLTVGALLALAKMLYLIDAGVDRLGIGGFISIIPYSEMAMLLGFFAVFSIGWDQPRSWMTVVPKGLALLAGLSTAYFSQTRGAWLAIPIIAIIALGVSRVRRSRKYSALILAAVLLGGTFCFGDIAQQRVAEVKNDIHSFIQGNDRDTSIGLRFQMWQGSWLLFKQSPFFGVGRDVFPEGLKELAASQVISAEAAHNGQGHSHNEILYNMAAFGLVGLLALLMTYFVPAAYFLKAAREPDRKIRWAAGMGLTLCLGFFVFGLTDVQFLWGHCNVFYSTHAALFLAYIVKRKAVLRDGAILSGGRVDVSSTNFSATGQA